MVPTLNFSRGILVENGFINGYSKDRSREVQYENCIYLLFRPKNVDKFRIFLEKEYERMKVVDDYDYEGEYVIVVYELDKKYSKDFNLIRQGKYSKTSKQFQEQFSKLVKVMTNGLHKDDISLQYRIFNRTEDLIKFWEDKFNVEFDNEQEVWIGWDDDKETLYIDKIRENDKQSIGERANS
jgi:hypothetical protein